MVSIGDMDSLSKVVNAGNVRSVLGLYEVKDQEDRRESDRSGENGKLVDVCACVGGSGQRIFCGPSGVGEEFSFRTEVQKSASALRVFSGAPSFSGTDTSRLREKVPSSTLEQARMHAKWWCPQSDSLANFTGTKLLPVLHPVRTERLQAMHKRVGVDLPTLTQKWAQQSASEESTVSERRVLDPER